MSVPLLTRVLIALTLASRDTLTTSESRVSLDGVLGPRASDRESSLYPGPWHATGRTIQAPAIKSWTGGRTPVLVWAGLFVRRFDCPERRDCQLVLGFWEAIEESSGDSAS